MRKELEQFLELATFDFKESEFQMLKPSPAFVFVQAKHALRDCCQSLSSNWGESNGVKLSLITQSLNNIDKGTLDTEDREYVAFYFFQLAELMRVDASFQINKWLYGVLIASIYKIMR